VSTTRQLLDHFQKWLGGSVRFRKSKNPRAAPSWEWSLRHSRKYDLRPFLRAVAPHVLIKSKQLESCVRQINGGDAVTEYYERRELNRRGTI
jgi:hypothetical protein